MLPLEEEAKKLVVVGNPMLLALFADYWYSLQPVVDLAAWLPENLMAAVTRLENKKTTSTIDVIRLSKLV